MKDQHTVMAFDFGLKQIGVAAGTPAFATTQVLPIITARDGVPDWKTVEALIAEWRPAEIIVGDPLNMDGTVSEMALRARKFAKRLHGRLGLTVHMVDERLSSRAVKEMLKERGHSGDFRRAPADSYAAELLLQSWYSEATSGP